MLSIRIVFVGLVVACIVVVATLCTTLSLLSGDRALEDTREVRDSSVAAASNAGEATTVKITEDYLDQIGKGAVQQISSFWGVVQHYTDSLCQTVMAPKDPAVIGSFAHIYSLRTNLYYASKNLYEIQGAGLTTVDHQTVTISEFPATFNSTDFHHYSCIINNGSGYDVPGGMPAQYRTQHGEIIPDSEGDMYGWPDRVEGMYGTDCWSSGYRGVESKGAVLGLACVTPGSPVIATNLQALPYIPFGVSVFSPLISYGRYVAVIAQCAYGDPATQQRIGVALAGADVRKITTFLQTVDLGQDEGSFGRVFVTVRSHMLDPTNVGMLAGTSHGDPSLVTDTTSDGIVEPIAAVNCTDPIVAATAKYLLTPTTHEGVALTMNERLYAENKAHLFNSATDRAPEGEDFLMRVHVYNNQRGIDWFVITMIDREYILGEVDRTVLATQRHIDDSEADVKADLQASRRILYIVVALLATVPTFLAVLLVFRITAPLLRLSEDMACVAVMNLSVVDTQRSTSILSEVGTMEDSFKRMIQNLIEYRQYLPQAVLQESEAEEEDADSARVMSQSIQPSEAQGQMSRSGSQHTSGKDSSVVGKKNVLKDSVMRKKAVTLLVSNIKAFHADRRADPSLSGLVAYFTQFVATAQGHRGIIDSVSGDKVYVSYNTVIASSNHKSHAVQTANQVTSKLREGQETKRYIVNVGIASTDSYCGNIGCNGLRSFSVIGACVANARMLERFGRHLGLSIVADGTVSDDAKFRFTVKSIAKAIMSDGKPTHLREVLGEKCVAEEEWMYQIEAAAAGDPCKAWNETCAAMYSGQIADVRKFLDSDKETRGGGGGGDDGPNLTLTLMQECVACSVAPLPIDLFGFSGAFSTAWRGRDDKEERSPAATILTSLSG